MKSRQCIVGCLGQLVVASFGLFVGFCRAGVVWWGFVGGVLCENCRVDASIIPATCVVWWGGVFSFFENFFFCSLSSFFSHIPACA